MYKIIGKVLNGEELVKYEVEDLNMHQIKQLDIGMVYGLAMAGSITNAKYNSSKNKLEGKNYDLRTLSKKQVENKTNLVNTFILGKNLTVPIYKKERYVIKDLMNYLYDKDNHRVCVLYGLRRTGKTVLMQQAIQHLLANGIDNVAYISLTAAHSLSKFYKQLNNEIKRGIKYFFIDEITMVSGFIQSSAILADMYTAQGIKIILAGTDSFLLELARRDPLYDRTTIINTSYISFKEYNYLFGSTILEYIRSGGVLYSDNFYNFETTHKYISTAITDNIINSLLRSNNRKHFQGLLELEDRGLLKKAIEQCIAYINEEITVEVVTRTYKNFMLGSAKQLLKDVLEVKEDLVSSKKSEDIENNDDEDDGVLNTREIEDRVRYQLRIAKDFDTEIDEKYIEELKEFLIDIGVIKEYKRTKFYHGKFGVIITHLYVQPGLYYNQALELVQCLGETKSFLNLPKKVREQLMTKIIEDVEGNLLEQVVLLNELQTKKITQFTYKGQEIDLIEKDGDFVNLFEIKRSKKQVKEQKKWLYDKELNDLIEYHFGKIKDRKVLYLGETGGDYINIEEFLK